MEVKPDKKLVVPTTLDDIEALLDYTDLMNRFLPSMGEIQADDYNWEYTGWLNSITPEFKNGYIWKKEIYAGENSISDWDIPYQIIFQANNALDGLNKLGNTPNETRRYNSIKGRALFFRAFAHFMVSQLYCAPYDKTKDNSGLGIPLRLSSDINIPSTRSTVKETYDQIIADLLTAENLLPQTESIKTRPSKSAVEALLSRVYLTMQDYEMALKYAEAVLNSGAFNLINFATINSSANYPMQRFNSEVIFHSEMNTAGPISVAQINIDSVLYQSFDNADLRKSAWFRFQNGKMRFKGSYNGSALYFNGLAVDECYLTKAECLARESKFNDALVVLNQLLSTRYNSSTPIVVGQESDVLPTILIERRKELLLRAIRWTDLRRLNLSSNTAKTLYRNLNGNVYTLMPNGLNYVLPIQPDVIRLTNMPQNTRE
ncbi:hypothetical protein GCM10011516_16150 [Sphingobacterium cellulitidis]|uniref:RagB/SusD family nutrient uptake outer membrane protein n=1 Tax=Sphingobacterium cellulitidis TaxID=1768011 RepID=A0A8H9G0I8_9SPHI|nr:hypothetical protein GCM10011516_16150 [Sphingobacterium soli]